MSEKGFLRGKVGKILFTKNQLDDILIVQIYTDDIIFSTTKESMCKEFIEMMIGEFEISMMEEMNFFLGL